jgi:hypothetical protein
LRVSKKPNKKLASSSRYPINVMPLWEKPVAVCRAHALRCRFL